MSDEITQTEKEELEQLRSEKANKTNGVLFCKVSAKGGVSLYGLGRFPVTLYRGQWEKLFPFIEDIKNFIAVSSNKLSTKE